MVGKGGVTTMRTALPIALQRGSHRILAERVVKRLSSLLQADQILQCDEFPNLVHLRRIGSLAQLRHVAFADPHDFQHCFDGLQAKSR
jgi:hypothetical protein